MSKITAFFAFISLILFAEAFLPTLPVKRHPSLKEETRQTATTGKISGGGKGFTYYVEIKAGNPPQSHNVIVDTGSAWLLLLANDCKTGLPGSKNIEACKNSSSGYQVGGSKTATYPNCTQLDLGHACEVCNGTTNIPDICCGGSLISRRGVCQMAGTYSIPEDISVVGNIVKDVVTLGNLNATTFLSSVTVELMGQIEAEGVLGLANRALSSDLPTWMDALVEAHSINDSFSLCIANGADEGGQLTLGGVDPHYFNGTFNSTSIIHDEAYEVNLLRITVGGNKPIANTYPAIIDSGSTFITLPPALYSEVVTALTSYCNVTNNTSPLLCDTKNNVINGKDQCCDSNNKISCAVFDQNALNNLPEIVFSFPSTDGHSEVVAVINGSSYIRYWWKDHDNFCGRLGFVKSNTSADNEHILLGDTFLSAVYTRFDRETKQIGFAKPWKCGYSTRPDEEDNGWSKSLIIALVVVGGILAGIAVAIVAYMVWKTIRMRKSGGYQPLKSDEP